MFRKLLIVVISASLWVGGNALAGQIYKWTDAEGNVVGASNGHRHTGNRWRRDDTWGAGQQVARSGQTGLLGGDANGDGIGVSLGCRVISGAASLFYFDVVIGGDVFGDTDTITTTEGVL